VLFYPLGAFVMLPFVTVAARLLDRAIPDRQGLEPATTDREPVAA